MTAWHPVITIHLPDHLNMHMENDVQRPEGIGSTRYSPKALLYSSADYRISRRRKQEAAFASMHLEIAVQK